MKNLNKSKSIIDKIDAEYNNFIQIKKSNLNEKNKKQEREFKEEKKYNITLTFNKAEFTLIIFHLFNSLNNKKEYNFEAIINELIYSNTFKKEKYIKKEKKWNIKITDKNINETAILLAKSLFSYCINKYKNSNELNNIENTTWKLKAEYEKYYVKYSEYEKLKNKLYREYFDSIRIELLQNSIIKYKNEIAIQRKRIVEAINKKRNNLSTEINIVEIKKIIEPTAKKIEEIIISTVIDKIKNYFDCSEEEINKLKTNSLNSLLKYLNDETYKMNYIVKNDNYINALIKWSNLHHIFVEKDNLTKIIKETNNNFNNDTNLLLEETYKILFTSFKEYKKENNKIEIHEDKKDNKITKIKDYNGKDYFEIVLSKNKNYKPNKYTNLYELIELHNILKNISRENNIKKFEINGIDVRSDSIFVIKKNSGIIKIISGTENKIKQIKKTNLTNKDERNRLAHTKCILI